MLRGVVGGRQVGDYVRPRQDLIDRRPVERDRIRRAEHEEAVAARPERDDHVREDRAVGPDVGLELIE